jgi:hypothetical protein
MNYFTKIALIISLFCITETRAQNNDLYVVKLKSGLAIKCELVKVVTDSFIVIRQYGLESTIRYDDVVSIEYSESLVKHTPGRTKKVVIKRNLPDSGWSIGVQPGFCIGLADDDWLTSSFLFRLSILKTVSPRWQAGITLGLDPYAYYGVLLGSMMGEGRFYLETGRPRAAFLYGQAGYGLSLVSEKPVRDGGLIFEFGMGKAYRNKKQNIFSYMLGYKVQKARHDVTDWNWPGVRYHYYSLRRFVCKVEWRF